MHDAVDRPGTTDCQNLKYQVMPWVSAGGRVNAAPPTLADLRNAQILLREKVKTAAAAVERHKAVMSERTFCESNAASSVSLQMNPSTATTANFQRALAGMAS